MIFLNSTMVRATTVQLAQQQQEERFVRRPMIREFGSIVSIAESASGMDGKSGDSSVKDGCDREGARAQQHQYRTRFLLRFLEEKMFDLSRQLHIRQGKATIRRMLRYIPGVRKSAKAKGYEHLVTDEERRLVGGVACDQSGGFILSVRLLGCKKSRKCS